MATKRLTEIKAQLQACPRLTPWENVHVGDRYHLPKILNLESRDIEITSKDNDKAEYKRVDRNANDNGQFHKTSIFGVLLVKKRKF